MFSTSLLFLASIALGDAPCAQELKPLVEIIGTDIEKSYPFVRCGAFYQASLEWAGENRVGSEMRSKIKKSIDSLLTVAALLRAKATSESPEWIMQIVYRDTRNIADLYIKRFEANYASEGLAWGNDALWRSDSETCKILSEKAHASLPAE